MTKVFRSTKKRVIHPLSCWDIITHQFSTLPNRGDLKMLENKKVQNNWTINFKAVLEKPYHSFIVIDTGYRICCKSKKFNQLRLFHSYVPSTTHKADVVALIKEFFNEKQFPTEPSWLSIGEVIPYYDIKFFPLATINFNVTHFFILVIAKK
jgi:hypothetical protein